MYDACYDRVADGIEGALVGYRPIQLEPMAVDAVHGERSGDADRIGDGRDGPPRVVREDRSLSFPVDDGFEPAQCIVGALLDRAEAVFNPRDGAYERAVAVEAPGCMEKGDDIARWLGQCG